MATMTLNMGRKKKPTSDRHKPGFTVRIPDAYGPALDKILDIEVGADRSELVRRAVREFLERRELWPPKD